MKSLGDLSRPPTGTGVSMTRMQVTRPFHGWLYYHVLAHLDLGAAPGSLFTGNRRMRLWLPALFDAVQSADDPVGLQLLPLGTRDYEALAAAVGDGVLGEAMRRALVAEFGRVANAWQADQGYAMRLKRFWSTVAGPLERCRRHLWADQPPPIQVFDVPTIGRHGRSLTLSSGRRVAALSLQQPPGHVLSRLLYEEGAALIGGRAGDPCRRPPPEQPSLIIERVEQAIAEVEPGLSETFHNWRGSLRWARAARDQQLILDN